MADLPELARMFLAGADALKERSGDDTDYIEWRIARAYLAEHARAERLDAYHTGLDSAYGDLVDGLHDALDLEQPASTVGLVECVERLAARVAELEAAAAQDEAQWQEMQKALRHYRQPDTVAAAKDIVEAGADIDSEVRRRLEVKFAALGSTKMVAAAPAEWREGVFDMDRIEWLQSELRRYDTMNLKSATFVRNGRSITPPVGTLEHFRFTGLRQADLCCFWDGTEPAMVDEAITADFDFDSPHDADDGGDCEGANDGQV